MFDYHKPREECGVIGIFAPDEDVASMTYFGLHALQHRGQEAAGIAVSNGQNIYLHKDNGLVSQVFTPQNLEPLKGKYAIGHTRYSTTGSSNIRNVQPFLIETRYGPLAVAHNGNLVNTDELRQDLLERGIGLSSTSDTEVITMMLAGAEGETWEERIRNTMGKWQGAYSLVILSRDCVFAIRDPWGFHPLSVGVLPNGSHIVASETCVLHTLGCVAIREVNPGEIITLSNSALSVYQAIKPAEPLAQCIFEHIYFARPDSVWNNLSIHQVRQRLGRELAREYKPTADLVIPVPDSSIPAAIGYAQTSQIPYNDGFIKNRYIGRTFIQPTDSLRKLGVAMKFNVIEENVRGQRLVVIDDSIVRGNTSGPLIRMLREAGATEVHLLITCPPIRYPCFMGVDMGQPEDLIAHRSTVEQVTEHIGCDSLHYLSIQGMMNAVGTSQGYCQACFTGNYPINIDHKLSKNEYE